MIWLAALAALPSAYMISALLRRDWERWLTPGKMLVVLAVGGADALVLAYTQAG